MPLVGAAAVGAGGNLLGGWLQSRAAAKAQRILLDKGNAVGHSIDKATQGAIDAGYAGITQANDALGQGLDRATAARDTSLSYVRPYQAAGEGAVTQLSQLLAPGGEFNHQFTAADMVMDPGYDFRMQAGQKALERSAAARGSLLGGGTQEAITRYAQDYSSNEYDKAFQRFESYFGMLSGLAGFGQTANSQAIGVNDAWSGQSTNLAGAKANTAMQGNQFVANAGLQGAEAAGTAYFGGANAQAAGVMAGGNIWGNVANNAGSSVGDYLTLSQLLKQQQNPSSSSRSASVLDDYGNPISR